MYSLQVIGYNQLALTFFKLKGNMAEFLFDIPTYYDTLDYRYLDRETIEISSPAAEYLPKIRKCKIFESKFCSK